jgi:amidase
MEPAFLSARSLARLVRARKFGCLELLEYFIARVERHDPKLNAVVVRDYAAARKRARAMDRRLARGDSPNVPFLGVPMTVKESYDVEGLPTTRGLTSLRGHRAERHAIAVQRMLDAGANVFGKTNVPVHLSDWQTFNPLFGTTNNPWDVSRTPGGSSGGGAAALAAGLTGLEMGSDIGASIRNPAHYCGVYGHKSTWGICARAGHNMGAFADPDISVLGPLARSAGDLAPALAVMAGPDAIDGAGWKLALPKPHRAGLREYRVAVMTNHPAAPVDKAVEESVLAVGDFLRREKATVSFDARPAIDAEEAHELYLLLLRSGTVGQLSPERLRSFSEERPRLDPARRDYYAQLVRGSTLSHQEWLKLDERRHRMRHQWADFFREWDVLLCPTAATVAFAHNHVGERWERMVVVNGQPQPSTTQLFWAGFSGAFYLPGTVAPAGAGPGGLPIGVQIVGPQFGDFTTIDLALRLEQGYRGFAPPPGYE